MRKAFLLGVISFSLFMISSCKEKKQDNIIIIKRPVAAKQVKPQRMESVSKETEINWLEARYIIRINQKPDTSLPLATDGYTKYYDNRIEISILRSDGTSFFKRTFAKTDFKKYVDDQYYEGGALLGIVFDKTDGKTLRFAASVGNPDKSSDEYVPLNISINNFGQIVISKSTEMDNE